MTAKSSTWKKMNKIGEKKIKLKVFETPCNSTQVMVHGVGQQMAVVGAARPSHHKMSPLITVVMAKQPIAGGDKCHMTGV